MRINGISAVNSYSANGLNRNQNNGVKKNDVQFGALVAQTAADSFGPLVQKNVNRFIEYMRNLTMQAVNKSGDATEKLRQLIGSDAANALIKNPEKYTQALDESVTKLSPLSGLGTRGEKIRNTITDTLGMTPTHKADVPLPAIGLGPTGAFVFGTATLNGLFGAVASFGIEGFGISVAGLYTGF